MFQRLLSRAPSEDLFTAGGSFAYPGLGSLGFGPTLLFLDRLPSFNFFLLWDLILWIVPLKVSMLLTGSAFEGEVFIVHFLVV